MPHFIRSTNRIFPEFQVSICSESVDTSSLRVASHSNAQQRRFVDILAGDKGEDADCAVSAGAKSMA
jgi:hypothetical protein